MNGPGGVGIVTPSKIAVSPISTEALGARLLSVPVKENVGIVALSKIAFSNVVPYHSFPRAVAVWKSGIVRPHARRFAVNAVPFGVMVSFAH